MCIRGARPPERQQRLEVMVNPMRHHLRVGFRGELVAAALEFRAQLLVILPYDIDAAAALVRDAGRFLPRFRYNS